MSKSAKIIIGIAGSLIVIITGVLFTLRYLTTKSFSVTEGIITVSGLHSTVEIFRDEFGVPHIRASDERDLMFGVGYVHTQDRLFQMELQRRAGEGRLSELFDTVTIRFDKLFRTLSLAVLAESIQAHLDPRSLECLEDYARGVNEFLRSHKGKYPVEFDMLNAEPEYWKATHSILVARLMAWELNFSWWEELTYAEIQERVSPDLFREILPMAYPLPVPAGQHFKGVRKELQALRNTAREYREFMNLGPFTAGSNAWVIASSKSASGKPIVANDPHLKISLPAKWYEVHLSAPGWNVAGVTIPGVPFVIIGHNDSLAWGLTNAMLDDADFYYEQLDSVRNDHYRMNDQFFPITRRPETIYVGNYDSLEIVVRSTRHGPVVNEVHPSWNRQGVDSALQNAVVSMRWTGFEYTNEFACFYKINKARNRYEFEDGIRRLTVPAQCVVYGDVEGNYALWVAGNVPVRQKGFPLLPLRGWTGDEEWNGFVPFEELPKRINPPEGFIVSANQQITGESYPYYLSAYWEPPSRVERIHELLSSPQKLSVHDFELFQQDVVSYYMRDLTGILLQSLPPDSLLTPEVRRSLEYLRNWDYRCTQYDIATTIIHAFYLQLLRNTLEDELGSEVFDDFVYFTAVPYRIMIKLANADSSYWFDDIRTEHRETRGEMIQQSLFDALSKLNHLLGSDMKQWQWGRVHTVTFEHPLGKIKPLDRVFNVGPFPVGGSGTSISKAEFRFTQPFAFFAGVSMRQIVDLANPSAAYMVIPLGQSGQPLHDHYSNQTALWINGGYRTVTTDWNIITGLGWKRLELKP